MAKDAREPHRADVIVREPGLGLLWGGGMFGSIETFRSAAARPVTRPAPEMAARDSADDDRVNELLEELLGDTDD
jgi:hypothetical protein